jgi:hypothetical protein
LRFYVCSCYLFNNKKNFMKTNLLIATALLLSAAGFSQQSDTKTIQSETASDKIGGDASVQVSAHTRIKSGAAGSAENQVAMAKKKAKTVSSSTEKKASGQANAAIDKSREATEGNTSAQTSLQSNSDANAGSGNNKQGRDASLITGSKASASGATGNAGVPGKEGQATAATKTTEALKTTTMVKNETEKGITKTADGSSRSVKAAGGNNQSVKPRSVQVKAHSQIKTNAGIKIK